MSSNKVKQSKAAKAKAKPGSQSETSFLEAVYPLEQLSGVALMKVAPALYQTPLPFGPANYVDPKLVRSTYKVRSAPAHNDFATDATQLASLLVSKPGLRQADLLTCGSTAICRTFTYPATNDTYACLQGSSYAPSDPAQINFTQTPLGDAARHYLWPQPTYDSTYGNFSCWHVTFVNVSAATVLTPLVTVCPDSPVLPGESISYVLGVHDVGGGWRWISGVAAGAPSSGTSALPINFPAVAAGSSIDGIAISFNPSRPTVDEGGLRFSVTFPTKQAGVLVGTCTLPNEMEHLVGFDTEIFAGLVQQGVRFGRVTAQSQWVRNTTPEINRGGLFAAGCLSAALVYNSTDLMSEIASVPHDVVSEEFSEGSYTWFLETDFEDVSFSPIDGVYAKAYNITALQLPLDDQTQELIVDRVVEYLSASTLLGTGRIAKTHSDAYEEMTGMLRMFPRGCTNADHKSLAQGIKDYVRNPANWKKWLSAGEAALGILSPRLGSVLKAIRG